MGGGDAVRVAAEPNDDYLAEAALATAASAAGARPPEPVPNALAAAAAAALPRALHEVLRGGHFVLCARTRRRALHEVVREGGGRGDHAGEELGAVAGLRVRDVRGERERPARVRVVEQDHA